jgi:hypothetical protein
VQADKSREEFLVFLHRNHQREEIDGQESVGRISEIPPAVRSAREARRLQLHPEFKLRRLWTAGSAHRYPSAVGLTGSCTKVKLHGREEESSDERRGPRDFGIREIGNHEDE